MAKPRLCARETSAPGSSRCIRTRPAPPAASSSLWANSMGGGSAGVYTLMEQSSTAAWRGT
eukprot:6430819-Alexandrium_andersonii.AAC.1